jgi:hypothetical protein
VNTSSSFSEAASDQFGNDGGNKVGQQSTDQASDRQCATRNANAGVTTEKNGRY